MEERVFADDESRLQLVPALLELVVDRLALFLVELFSALVDQIAELVILVAGDVLRTRWVEERERQGVGGVGRRD